MVHGSLIRALPHLLLVPFGRRARFRVTGDSMAPALRAGDRVVVDLAAYRAAPPRAGDVVLARHPFRRDLRLIKRVARVDAEGRCHLRGDNPDASTDSRSFGDVARERIVGRVVLGWR